MVGHSAGKAAGGLLLQGRRQPFFSHWHASSCHLSSDFRWQKRRRNLPLQQWTSGSCSYVMQHCCFAAISAADPGVGLAAGKVEGVGWGEWGLSPFGFLPPPIVVIPSQYCNQKCCQKMSENGDSSTLAHSHGKKSFISMSFCFCSGEGIETNYFYGKSERDNFY